MRGNPLELGCGGAGKKRGFLELERLHSLLPFFIRTAVGDYGGTALKHISIRLGLVENAYLFTPLEFFK